MNEQTNSNSTSNAGWDLQADSAQGRNAWISSKLRVAELVYEATRVATVQLAFDASSRPIVVQMQQVQTHGYTHTLLVKGRDVSLNDESWSVGDRVTLWFAKRDGFFAFRSEIVSQVRDAIVLSMPEGVLRHNRRAHQRFRIPAPSNPRVMIALAEGTWRDTTGLVDISVGGMLVHLPAAMRPENGAVVRFGLRLQPDRLTEMNAIVRHGRPDGEGICAVGVEFVGLSNTARLSLERYLLKTKAVPLPDVVTGLLPQLPESVRVQLAQAAPASINGAPAPRRPAGR